MDPAVALLSAPPPAVMEDRTPAALQFLQDLLQSPPGEASTPTELLGGLARAFAARGAGVATPLDATPVVRLHVQADGQPELTPRFPWDEQTDLLGRVREAAAALPARTADGTAWLCAAVPTSAAGGWLLWLTADAPRLERRRGRGARSGRADAGPPGPPGGVAGRLAGGA